VAWHFKLIKPTNGYLSHVIICSGSINHPARPRSRAHIENNSMCWQQKQQPESEREESALVHYSEAAGSTTEPMAFLSLGQLSGNSFCVIRSNEDAAERPHSHRMFAGHTNNIESGQTHTHLHSPTHQPLGHIHPTAEPVKSLKRP
jgi:hypothetical protein